jgi:hypothetical protein
VKETAMTDKKDVPTRPSIGMDHKGAVLPSAPSKAPMPAVKPTEGAKPNPPVKSK